MLLRYGIPRAWRSLIRNGRSTVNTVLILTASLAMLGMIALLYLNVDHFARVWLSNTSVSLFLRDDLGDDGRAAILERVRRHPLVKAAVLVPPSDALKSLAQRLGDGHGLLAGIESDSLPYAIDFDVVVDYRRQLGEIVRVFRNIPGVEDVVYTERMLDKVDLFFAFTQGIGLFFMGLMALSFYLTISHATRLSLHGRREEVEILDLVGATPGLIRSAFVMEGVLIAGAACLVSAGVVAGCYALVNLGLGLNPLTAVIQGETVFVPWEALAAAAAAALGLSALSSLLAVRRMLREFAP
jgi:cell division transport system permease protein